MAKAAEHFSIVSESYLQTQQAQTVPVWDLAVRLFHWSLVILFFTAFLLKMSWPVFTSMPVMALRGWSASVCSGV